MTWGNFYQCETAWKFVIETLDIEGWTLYDFPGCSMQTLRSWFYGKFCLHNVYHGLNRSCIRIFSEALSLLQYEVSQRNSRHFVLAIVNFVFNFFLKIDFAGPVIHIACIILTFLNMNFTIQWHYMDLYPSCWLISKKLIDIILLIYSWCKKLFNGKGIKDFLIFFTCESSYVDIDIDQKQ